MQADTKPPDSTPIMGEIADTTPLGGHPESAAAKSPPRPKPAAAVKRPGDWAPTGPNGEKPNTRLAHIPKDSPLRAIHGELYPAVAYVRGDEVEYRLPTTDTGEADAALQRAGFFSPYADRICRLCPHFVLIAR